MPQKKRHTETLEERLDDALRLTNGTMPLAVLFETEEEVTRARRYLKGKRRAKLLRIETRAEADARLRASPPAGAVAQPVSETEATPTTTSNQERTSKDAPARASGPERGEHRSAKRAGKPNTQSKTKTPARQKKRQASAGKPKG